MGSRADFYAGRGNEAEWLGSLAMDGSPDGIPNAVFVATTVESYRTAVFAVLEACDSASLPKHGCPWPWDDSRLTDFAYAFDNGEVYVSFFGSEWQVALAVVNLDPDEWPQEETAVFPNMEDRQNVTLGKRSATAKAGDCFSYRTDKEHSVLNCGRSVAKILIVKWPPQLPRLGGM